MKREILEIRMRKTFMESLKNLLFFKFKIFCNLFLHLIIFWFLELQLKKKSGWIKQKIWQNAKWKIVWNLGSNKVE